MKLKSGAIVPAVLFVCRNEIQTEEKGAAKYCFSCGGMRLIEQRKVSASD